MHIINSSDDCIPLFVLFCVLNFFFFLIWKVNKSEQKSLYSKKTFFPNYTAHRFLRQQTRLAWSLLLRSNSLASLSSSKFGRPSALLLLLADAERGIRPGFSVWGGNFVLIWLMDFLLSYPITRTKSLTTCWYVFSHFISCGSSEGFGGMETSK